MDDQPLRSDRSRAVLMRDAAVARVSRTRRWVIAGAAVLTAGFAALVSAVAPGRSVSSSKAAGGAVSSASASGATSSASGAGSSIPRMPAPASAGDLGLQSPDQVPSPDQSQPQSVPSQPQPDPQPAPAPAPQAAPFPQSSGGGGGVVSGGS